MSTSEESHVVVDANGLDGKRSSEQQKEDISLHSVQSAARKFLPLQRPVKALQIGSFPAQVSETNS